MAERTGNHEVDALIEEFLRTPMGDWIGDDQPYEALRNPSLAHGACQEVTEHFVEFAKSKGFKAYETNTDLDELGYTPQGEPHGEVLDEDGEITQGFYAEHTIATVVVSDPRFHYGLEYYIDFTASQYGYTEHPKVTSNGPMIEHAGDPTLNKLEEFPTVQPLGPDRSERERTSRPVLSEEVLPSRAVESPREPEMGIDG